MERAHEPRALRDACERARARGERVGLVPTMGALHAGHMSLVEEAKRRAAYVAVSIFVNPTQFGPGEDLDRYPRTLEADGELCERAGVSLVFAPATSQMYGPGDETRVAVGATAAALCGAHRSGHFEGVCTVVAKLFALAGPCVAVFGRKDYQQWRVVARMARDLFLPVEVVGAPTVREPDGLALSSRNAYLSQNARARARSLSRGLGHAARAFETGERRVGTLRDLVRREVVGSMDSVDYVELASADDVAVFADEDDVHGAAVLAVAARIDGTRLIDNVVLGEDPLPA